MNGGIVGLEKSLGEIKVGITNMVMKHDDLEHKQDELSKYVHGRVKAGLKASLPGVDHYPFSFGKALLAISAMNRGQAHLVKEWNVGHELDVMTQATKKAMDTGTAITGPGRLDLFCGADDRGERVAGELRHPGTISWLQPLS